MILLVFDWLGERKTYDVFVPVIDDDYGYIQVKNTLTGEYFGTFEIADKDSVICICDLLNGLVDTICHWQREFNNADKLLDTDKKDLFRTVNVLSSKVLRLEFLHDKSCEVCRETVEDILNNYPGDAGLLEFKDFRKW